MSDQDVIPGIIEITPQDIEFLKCKSELGMSPPLEFSDDDYNDKMLKKCSQQETLPENTVSMDDENQSIHSCDLYQLVEDMKKDYPGAYHDKMLVRPSDILEEDDLMRNLLLLKSTSLPSDYNFSRSEMSDQQSLIGNTSMNTTNPSADQKLGFDIGRLPNDSGSGTTDEYTAADALLLLSQQ